VVSVCVCVCLSVSNTTEQIEMRFEVIHHVVSPSNYEFDGGGSEAHDAFQAGTEALTHETEALRPRLCIWATPGE